MAEEGEEKSKPKKPEMPASCPVDQLHVHLNFDDEISLITIPKALKNKKKSSKLKKKESSGSDRKRSKKSSKRSASESSPPEEDQPDASPETTLLSEKGSSMTPNPSSSEMSVPSLVPHKEVVGTSDAAAVNPPSFDPSVALPSLPPNPPSPPESLSQEPEEKTKHDKSWIPTMELKSSNRDAEEKNKCNNLEAFIGKYEQNKKLIGVPENVVMSSCASHPASCKSGPPSCPSETVVYTSSQDMGFQADMDETNNAKRKSFIARRRDKMRWTFLFLLFWFIVAAAVTILVMFLPKKNDASVNDPIPQVTTGEFLTPASLCDSPSLENSSGRASLFTPDENDEYAYADDVFESGVLLGIITSQMAPIEGTCGYKKKVVDDSFPHVYDQCECDGNITIVPDDVRDMRMDLIERGILNVVYDQSLEDIPVGSCDSANMALYWLSSGNNRDAGGYRQRFILALAYFAMDGLRWTTNDGWVTESNECLWHGVQCNKQTTITHVILESNNVAGKIPSEFGKLDGLVTLSFGHNLLTGTIPRTLFGLDRLRALRLENNQLQGPIPSQIETAKALEVMCLQSNSIGGTLPPGMRDATSLVDLSLQNNKISREIPSEIFEAMINLSYLDLSNNAFSGSVPSSIGKLDKLQTLKMSSNLLYFTIPTEFGSLTNLIDLRMDGNYIEGFLPTEMGQCSSLRILHLGGNDLGGPIPTEIGQVSSLSFLQLTGNKFIGSIPTEVGELTELRVVTIDSNSLSGTVPKEIGQLSSLEILTLHKNELSGNMPLEVCNLFNSVGRERSFIVDCVDETMRLGVDCESNSRRGESCCTCLGDN